MATLASKPLDKKPMKPLISLLTDFGTKDPFVGEMKAAIFSICPEAHIIDVSHEVEQFNIRMGAFMLASAAPYFPTGTVHLAVVDPGVGSKRRAIAIESGRALYVGPDNGLLIPAAKRDGINHIYELTNRSLMRNSISSTFHGRDVFAPVAAHLACGRPVSAVGEELSEYVNLVFDEAKFDKLSATCEIVHIDSFGNVVTNIPSESLDELNASGRLVVQIGRRRFKGRLVKTYSQLRGSEIGFLIGSRGLLEIACRERSAANRLGARAGDTLRVVVD